MTLYPGNDRRQYVRVPFQKNLQYRLCYEKFANTIMDANAANLSQNGILFKTKYPPPTSSVISLNIEVSKLKDYLRKEKLTDIVEPNDLFSKGDSIFGEVVRVIAEPQSGFFSVAVKLILKKDANGHQKIEEARFKEHPQYIDPSLEPEEEKYDPKKGKGPSHPQYIDPTKAPEDE